MSRLSALVRRIFGNVQPILEDISTTVLPVVLAELKSAKFSTDDERRDLVKRIVEQAIDLKYPEYAWLTDRAVDFVFMIARSALQKRGK